MKVVSIVGVRPQFIKLFPISQALRLHHKEIIIHTGQHYDFEMSDLFLDELNIPKPDYNLQIGSGSHAEQTAQMMMGIEKILLQERPDIMLVFGDTNSTLAGALAASKLHIPFAHIEAGLRSNNRKMPEEINRIVTDHLANLLYCPTQTAIRNLASEGITQGVHWVGDVMYDAALFFGAKAHTQSQLLSRLEIESGKYLLATIHRSANTDSPEILGKLVHALALLDELIIFPVHPRTAKALKKWNITVSENVHMIEPVSYLDMLALEQQARKILTDSGGVQKEAFFFGVPCITLRNETEWVELAEAGWNCVVGFDIDRIITAVKDWSPAGKRPEFFGDGHAAEQIIAILEKEMLSWIT